ncbi:hypothetical protein FOMPIDRAFT_61872 [Fomitopsis schrenkii]|uniref:DASH complex subunit DAM1 n=1 Tax=Fomitopsis schrenkii TaxID=2126942 RepID=S8FC91_FOMSC|nr:hypothetical protein FOMPIDRAFT_61872 [Fomitopsis schrenkii]
MNSVPPPQRTPLRRVSQGSLRRLSRSGVYPDAPHGLGFLEPALGELLDDIETLNTNIQGLRNLGDALSTFNESFASWLYVMNMNALTVDWPQVRSLLYSYGSYICATAHGNRARDTPIPRYAVSTQARRAEEDTATALAALRAAEEAAARPPTPPPAPDPGNDTVLADATATSATTTTTATKVVVKKKAGKPKLSAKEKKERGLLVERVANALPLEFRGGDLNLRRYIEQIVEGFLDRPGRGVGILELVKPPDLNQARVNKCLIALVNRKIVRKDNSTGAVLYHWHGLPN